MRLLLDFFPGHVALDHPWRAERPEFLIAGDPSATAQSPEPYDQDPEEGAFARVNTDRGSLDDALQLNLRHAGVRAAVLAELDRVLEQCDGVHMSYLDSMRIQGILERWGDRSLPADGSPPVDTPFWPQLVQRVGTESPGIIVVQTAPLGDAASSEDPPIWTLDDRLRELLLSGTGDDVRAHLAGRLGRPWVYLNSLERDGHPRIAEALSPERATAASVISALAPHGTVFEDGQLEGRRRRWDSRIVRRPSEPVDREAVAFHEALLEVLGRPEVARGSASVPLLRAAWDDNPSWSQFVVLLLEARDSGGVLLVAVNFGPRPAQCYVDLAELDPAGREWTFQDLLSLAMYVRDGDDLAARGLYLDLPAWDYQVFDVRCGR
jgi:hypothetical protein